MSRSNSDNPSDPTPAVPEADVRPHRPRPALPEPTFTEPPTAFDRNSRGTAMAMLASSLILFAIACALFARVTTGAYLPIGRTVFDPHVPLGQLMIAPQVSIYQVPSQAAVLALMLATFVTATILAAQFFGKVWALLFVGMVGALAHLPTLAVSLLPTVWLAQSQRLGVTNRVLRAMTALLFPAVALWVSTARADVSRGPMEKLYLHLPWVVAIALSMVSFVVFWIAARLVRYRAVIGPAMLALLVGITVVVFVSGVGMDELEFRMLDYQFGWSGPHSLQAHPEAHCDDLAATQAAAAEAANRFIAAYPKSRYMPNVLHILGRSQDMQRVEGPADAACYGDVPRPASRATWARLLRDFPRHPLATVARVRLAQQALAGGEIDAGAALLREVRHGEMQPVADAPPPPARTSFINLTPREPRRPEIIRQEIRPVIGWLALVEMNRGPGSAGDEPLARLFALDPHRPDYAARLAELRDRYRTSRLGDNLEVLVRMQQPNPADRIARLREFAASQPQPADSDAHDQAISELASLLVQQPDPAARTEAEQLWTELYRGGHDLFVARAREGLISLGVLDAASQPVAKPD